MFGTCTASDLQHINCSAIHHSDAKQGIVRLEDGLSVDPQVRHRVDELDINQTVSIFAHLELDPAVLAPHRTLKRENQLFHLLVELEIWKSSEKELEPTKSGIHPQLNAQKKLSNCLVLPHCPPAMLPGLPLQKTTWADGHSKEPQPGS